MARRDEPLCRHCGHRFRTGADTPPETPGPDPLHRTMQFVLPPLPRRQAESDAAAPAAAAPPAASRGRRLLALLLTAAVFFAAAFFAAARLRPSSPAAVPSAASPVGVWETALHGKAAADARLEFEFDSGGAGRFSWQEGGPQARAGQTPLRWTLNPDGTLALALTPAPGGGTVSETLIAIFSRPAWSWRVDRAERRLVLGTLVFTETK